MTKDDHTCVKVALWPMAIFVVGLLGFMAFRVVIGSSPLPNGSAQYVPGAILLVTFSAILTANLLRVRLAGSRS